MVPKAKGEILGVVIVESGWGSMLPTIVLANLLPGGPAARCGQLNIGDQVRKLITLSNWSRPDSQIEVARCAAPRMPFKCAFLSVFQVIAINGISLVGLPLSTCQNYIKVGWAFLQFSDQVLIVIRQKLQIYISSGKM